MAEQEGINNGLVILDVDFPSITPENNQVLYVQFQSKIFILITSKWVSKMPKLTTQMFKLAICCSMFVAKQWGPNIGILNAKILV